MIAYHFTGDTLRDGRPVPAVGETLTHEGEIVWCKSGLYASRKPHQALGYAPGARLHMVECDRIEHEDGDKFVCRSRTIIVSIDATYLLRRFAADQALSVAHMWDMPDVVREYLTTLDETKRAAARDAARDAAVRAAEEASRREAGRLAAERQRDAAWDAAMTDFDARVERAFAEAGNRPPKGGAK